MRLDGGGMGLWLAVFLAGVSGATAGPAASSGRTAVLSNDTLWRAYLVYQTPVVLTPDGQTKALEVAGARGGQEMPTFQSPLPAGEWRQPDFDDAAWERRRAPVEPDQPSTYIYGNLVAWHTAAAGALICLRGKFLVDDPAKAADLRLDLEYVGGVAVFLNGTEVTRGHLPADAKVGDPASLAEKYPDDLYCLPGGLYLQDVKKNPEGFARRYRRLEGVVLPARLVKKGLNVLAVEVHRAALNEAATKAKRTPVGGMSVVPGLWPTAEVRRLTVTAASGEGLNPNVGRPKGIQVWTCSPYETVEAIDYGDPGPFAPMQVSAARNGVFSGRLVVSSDQAIKGLKAAVTDLKASGGGAIPASAVQVRCAEAAVPTKSATPTYRFDGLLETLPVSVPPVASRPPREFYLRNGAYEGQLIERPGLACGALAPLWVTIRVPKDAQPGDYEGTITVSAEGLSPTAVPLRVHVAAWTLPDPPDYRVQHLGFNSPESLVRHYSLTLWSDRHFEMIGRTLALMAELNSREVLVDCAIDWYGMGGNRESVIRWVHRDEGPYEADFSVFDKYLETVAKSLGKPRPLRLNCWGEIRPGWKIDDSAKTVSRLDPATGKTEPMLQPTPGTPESLAFWKPVLDEVRKKVEARGWFDVTSMGHNTYNAHPYPAIVSVFRQVWPDGVWSYTAHNGQLSMNFAATEKGVTMPARYTECVWTRGELAPRGYTALLKPRPAIWCWTWRGVLRDWSDLALVRGAPEGAIMRGHDGVGQLGADIFPFPGPNNRPTRLNVDRGGLGPSNSTLALLAPGPDGPIATERYEAFREGVELAEAILFIQRALDEKKVSGNLAQRANRYLDERGLGYIWCWSSGRAERDAQLLSLAAEVARS